MKKLLVLITFAVLSLQASAGSVTIINTLGIPITGRLGGQADFYPSLGTGHGWTGVIVTIPPTGLSFTDVGAFYTFTMGGAPFPGIWGPPSNYYQWSCFFQPASGNCVWAAQIGSDVTYSPCTPYYSSGYHVKMYRTGSDSYIEIY